MDPHVTQVSSNVAPALAVGAAALLLAIIGGLVLVVLVVANRADPDSRGLRPFTVYLFAMSYITLFVAYVGSIVIVESLTSLMVDHPFPVTNSVARGCVVGAILTVLAGATMAHHLSRGRRIAWTDGRVDGPNSRVLHSYVAAVAFLAIAVAVVALGVAIYFVFELAGPGVFGGGAVRSGTARSLIDAAYVAVGAAAIAWLHLRWGPAPLLPGFLRPSPPPSAGTPAPAPGPTGGPASVPGAPVPGAGVPGAPVPGAGADRISWPG